MSNIIDTNIVKMVFDNAKFNKNVEESAKNIESLKNTFSNVENIATKAGFHIQDVWQKMTSYFEYNVANKLVNSLTSLTKSMSVDQVTAGWDKFQEKTVAVQTIVSATGKTVDEVNKQLDKLVWFSDETSYSFTDMTSNIGKFTAAGVELETAANAMQGISTWAALAGQDANAASRAMYNLSQSIGMGYMTTMDWSSIENANMATIEFKNNLIETAKSLGTIKKVGTDKNGKSLYKAVVNGVTKGNEFNAEGLRNELSQGWATNEVILKTLDKYGAFATKLQEATEETDLTATDLLQAIKAFENGEDLSEYIDASAVSSEKFSEILKELSRDTYSLGRKAFSAAQECKTFEDVINATKDAVSTKWMETFNYIFGDLDEAKEFWTEMVDDFYTLFAEAGDSRNRIMKAWSNLGGRQDFLDSYRNIMDNIINVIDVVKKSFHDIFGKLTGEKLKKITGDIANFTEKIKLSDEILDKLRKTLKGIFAIADILFTISKRLISAAIKPLLNVLGKTSSGVLDTAASFGDWLQKLDKTIKESKALSVISNGLGKAIGFVAKVLVSPLALLQKILPYLIKAKNILIDFSKNVFGGFINLCKKAGKAIKEFIDQFSLFNILVKILNFAKGLLEKVLSIVKELALAIVNVIKNFSLEAGVEGIAKFGFFAWLIKAFKTLKNLKNTAIGFLEDVVSFKDNIESALFGLADSITGALGALADGIRSWANKNNMEYIKTVATTVAILAASLFVLAQLDSKQLAIGLSGVSALLGEVYSFMQRMNTISADIKSSFAVILLAKALIKVAFALVLLSYAVSKLGQLNIKDLAKGLVSVSVLLAGLGLMMKKMAKLSGSFKTDVQAKVIKTLAKNMIYISIAVLILAESVKKLGSMSMKDLGTGLLGLAGIAGILVGLCWSLKKIEINDGVGKQLILISASITILALMAKTLGKMKLKDLGTGLLGLLSISGILSGFAMSLRSVKIDNGTAFKLLILSGVIAILSIIAKSLGKMKLIDLVKGLGSLIIISGLLVGLSEALTYVNISPSAAASLVIISTAIAILTVVAKVLGTIDLISLAKGLGSLIIMTGALVGFAAAIHSIGFNPKDASAIIIMSAAIGSLALSMMLIGKMNTGDLVKGIVGMTVALSVLVGVAYLVKSLDLAPSLMKFAGSIAVLGASFIALGIGTTLLGIGLTAISVGIYAISKAIVAVGEMIDDIIKVIIRAIKDFIVGIIDLIPSILDAIFSIFTSIADNIGNIIGSIYKIIKEVLKVVIDAFTTVIPDLVVAIIKFIDVALAALAEHLPSILKSILKIIIGVIEGLAENSVEIIGALFHLIESIFKGFAEAFKNFDSSEIKDGIEGMLLFAGMASAIAVAGALVPAAIVGAFELVALAKVLTTVFKAFASMNQEENIEWFMSEGAKFLQMFGTAIGKFIGGLIGGIASGITSNLPDIANDLSNFMYNLQPFIEMSSGLSGIDFDSFGKLTSGLLLLTGAELLDSISKWINESASYSELGNELSAFGESIKPFLEMAPMFNGLDLSGLGQIGGLILQLTKAKILEGLTSWITGEHDFAEFGRSLSEFAEGLVDFGNSAKNTDTEAIEKVLPIIEKLIELEDNLANHGGVAGFFAGDNDFEQFGNTLSYLADGVASFSEKVAAISSFENVDEAIEIVGKLIELDASLANHGGVAGFFAGDNDFKQFGNNLGILGEGLYKYNEQVSGLNFGLMNLSLTPLEGLLTLDSKLTDHGGVVGWWNGDTDLGDFGDTLEDLGEGLKEYSDEICDITSSQFDNMTKSVSILRGLAKIDSEYSEEFDEDSFEYFEDFGENAGSGLYALYEHVTKIKSWHSLQTAKNVIKNLVKSMSNVKDYKKTDLEGFPEESEKIGSGLYKFYESAKKIYSYGTIKSAIEPAKGLSNIIKSFKDYKKVTIDGLDTSMGKIGAGLVSFKDALGDSVTKDNLDLIAESTLASTKLAVIVKAFTDYSKVSVNGLDESMTKIGTGLRAYWDALMGDSNSKSKSLDSAGMLLIQSSVTAAQSLSDIVRAYNNFDMTIANSNLGGFKDCLTHIGDGMSAYYTAISGITDMSLITDSIDNITALNNLVISLNDYKGISKAQGVKYADGMTWIGTGLKGYYSQISAVEDSGWTGTVSSTLPVATLLLELFKSGSEINEAAITTFASTNFYTACGNLGLGLSEFYLGAHLDEEKAPSMSDVSKAIEATKSLSSYLTSEDAKRAMTSNTFSGMTAAASNLGSGIKSFWTQTKDMKDVKNWDYEDTISATEDFIEIIADNGDDVSKLESTTYSNFFACVSSVCSALSTLYAAVKDVDTSKADSAIAEFSALKTFLTSENPITENNIESLSNFVNAVETLAGMSIETFTTTLANSKTSVISSINTWVTNIKTSLASETNKQKVKNGCKTLIDSASNTLQSSNAILKMKQAGSAAAQGYIDGINAKIKYVSNTSKNIGDTSAKATKDSIKSRSPSKVFKEIGGYAAEGFVIGLQSYNDEIKSKSSDMGYTAINGVSSAIARASALINDGVDSDPVIRPVMDLSDVENGVYQMSDLMSGIDSITYKAESVSRSMNKRSANQNEEAERLNQLYNSLSNMDNGNTTYENTFNISGNNPKEIANEISRIIDQQTRRRDMAWGI